MVDGYCVEQCRFMQICGEIVRITKGSFGCFLTCIQNNDQPCLPPQPRHLPAFHRKQTFMQSTLKLKIQRHKLSLSQRKSLSNVEIFLKGFFYNVEIEACSNVIKIQGGVTATRRTGMCQVENSKQKDTTESQDHTGLERWVGRVHGRVGQ